MASQSLNKEQCNKIYDILVEHVEAYEKEREAFIRHHSLIVRQSSEWRCLGGNLGFGGRFWVQGNGLSVSCDEEDMTYERFKIIEKVNALLKEVYSLLE